MRATVAHLYRACKSRATLKAQEKPGLVWDWHTHCMTDATLGAVAEQAAILNVTPLPSGVQSHAGIPTSGRTATRKRTSDD